MPGPTSLISSHSFNSYAAVKGENWPQPPGADAFAGLAGDVVRGIEPFSEADPVALLVNFLIAFGSAVGSGARFMVGPTQHHPREFAALVGDTAKARKGDSWAAVSSLFRLVDPEWAATNANGLSTGEGLIHAVRDPLVKREPVKSAGRTVDYEDVIVDHGVADKRLLVVEAEFAKVLRVVERQGNSLSPVLRSAWDTGDLRVMTRANPILATGAHISMLVHVTIEELKRELSDVSTANGFANRFMWFAVRRSKLLPEPEPFEGKAVNSLVYSVSRSLAAAKEIGELKRDSAARELWAAVYAELSDGKNGLAAALLARAEAHVLRLSMVYALLDASPVVRLDHLTAAIELWSYSERSVAHIFGDSMGDPVGDTILRALRNTEYLTRTEISSSLFGRNQTAARIDGSLQALLELHLVEVGTEETDGRPREIWRAKP